MEENKANDSLHDDVHQEKSQPEDILNIFPIKNIKKSANNPELAAHPATAKPKTNTQWTVENNPTD